MNDAPTVGLVPIESRPPRRLMEYEPEQVLDDATRAAQAIARVIASKERPVVINGRQYLEFEDWQTLGHFYGYTAGAETEPEFVQYQRGDLVATGFRACAVTMHRGRIISRAYALCMDDEPEWGARTRTAWHYVCKDGTLSAEDPGFDNIEWEANPGKPGKNRPKKQAVPVTEAASMHAIMSMAQTRACAKALRQALSWVIVLQKGLAPTPAEEMVSEGEEAERRRWEPTMEQGRAMLKAITDAGGTSVKQGNKPRVITLPRELAMQVRLPTEFVSNVLDERLWGQLYEAAVEFARLRGAAGGGVVDDGSAPAARGTEGAGRPRMRPVDEPGPGAAVPPKK
jgi:hypothetical protein